MQFPFQLSNGPFWSALVVGLSLLFSPFVRADSDYPRKPIRLLLGFPPGGGSDIVARLVAQPLGELLGQNVVVDNKPGAGGNIATEVLTKATPDGYTLILLPSGHASGAAMKKSLPFHPVQDFAWVSTITTYPLALAVAPGSPIQSFADLLQRARVEPGKYSYSSSGVGTAPHLIGEWILDVAGVNITHVPFRGGTGPMTELLAGRVDVMIDTMTLVESLLKDQRVRALAVTAPAGASNLSGVPAVADVLPGVAFESWLGIAAPAGTPPDIVDKLNQVLRVVLDQPAVRQKLVDLGGNPRASSPAEFQARVQRDIDSLRKVVSQRRIELE
jgi:tripartite-type tricarboxylate transporter receptor subunit TctC